MSQASQVSAENNIRPKLSDKDRLSTLKRIRNLCWEYDKQGADALDDCIQELEKRC